MAGNYDKQIFTAREIFLNYDQQEIIDKFQLKSDKNYIYLLFLNHSYRVSRINGAVEREKYMNTANNMGHETEKYEECLDYNVVMTIYDVLCYSKKRPVLAHEWCPLANLQVTMSSPSADIFNQKYADMFSGKTDQLWDACEKIGGRRPDVMAGADVCWEFDLFPFFPVQFRYWDKDEEFPAQIKLLWDKNSLKFMHFETLYYAMGILLETLLFCKCSYVPAQR